MLKRFDCIIAGGGMVGSAMALSLARQGKSVCVLESSAPPVPPVADEPRAARVVALNYASQQLLDSLGIWRALDPARLTPYRQMQVWDASGFGQISFSAADAGVSELGHIVENHVLEYALYAQCHAQEQIIWMASTPLTRFASDAESVVVTLDQGDILTAALLIGADGSRSQVRELAGMGWQVRPYQQQAVVAVVTTDCDAIEPVCWQSFSDRGVLAFLPLSASDYAIVWSVSDDEAGALLTMSDAEFTQAVTAAIDARPGRVLSVGERRTFALNGATADRYFNNRVVLIGDAAHQVHPLAGQGVNLGFADVAELAEQLSLTRRDPGSDSVLRRYERARSGENQAMGRLMDGFQWLFLNRNPALRLVRGLGLNGVDRLTPLKLEMLRFALG